jgi:hypothetical protein
VCVQAFCDRIGRTACISILFVLWWVLGERRGFVEIPLLLFEVERVAGSPCSATSVIPLANLRRSYGLLALRYRDAMAPHPTTRPRIKRPEGPGNVPRMRALFNSSSFNPREYRFPGLAVAVDAFAHACFMWRHCALARPTRLHGSQMAVDVLLVDLEDEMRHRSY